MAGCSLILVLTLNAVGQNSTSTEIRVAIVAYEDFHSEVEQFERVFAAISRKDPSLQFQLAVGSYGEALHWIDRRLVDLALLTPGVFAGLLPPGDNESRPGNCRYLATVQLPSARSKWASEERQAGGYHNTYQSVCLVAESSSLRTIDDVRTAARHNRVEFLFVHPLSVSGRAAPMEALRQAKIDLSDARIRFTYSHSESIRMLRKPESKVARVAFVWDDAAGNDPDLEQGTRQLAFPQLQRLRIPHDVVVARNDLAEADRIAALLLDLQPTDQRYRFDRIRDWAAQFRAVRGWLDAMGATSPARNGERTSLEEIGQLLRQYSRSQPRPPRLALVLSGGGAKCSYQVGAVAALEEKLAELRRTDPEHGPDVSLVVGTSGGAINSLPIAMGITRTEQGRQALRDTWCGLDQRNIVRPSLLMRANMGLWFALVQTSFVVWGVRRLVRQSDRRGRVFAVVYTVLAGVEILIGYLPGLPWCWLGSNHLVHHAWLWFSFGMRASAWTLFAIGVGALAMETGRVRRQWRIRIPRWFTKTTLVTGLLGLPLLQLVTVLTYEETLSGGEGMEHALATEFPRLINQHLEQQGLPPLALRSTAHPGQRLQVVSRQVMDRRLLKRDLVITGSCLEQTSRELPSDLYFYAPSDPAAVKPPFGERGLPLLDRPHILLDVVMGSGSIFPIFPARKINDVPRAGEKIQLVDGGFAHNSPVEAAVLWGATHIVLIEATPRTRSERGSFLRNAMSSFRHLHQQAQLIDARSRSKVVVLSLAPEPPHMCVLDFADNLVAAGIERGYHDAGISAISKAPRFRKERGEPFFVNVVR